jgi:hypothetical protein
MTSKHSSQKAKRWMTEGVPKTSSQAAKPK